MLSNGSPPKTNKTQNKKIFNMGGSNKSNNHTINSTKLLNKSIKKSKSSMSLLNNYNKVNYLMSSIYSEQSSSSDCSSDNHNVNDSNQSIIRDYISSSYHYPYSYSRNSIYNNFNSNNSNEDNNRSNNNINGRKSKKNTWGSRERAGMSFIIVIAFFGIFALIIITELFMIDDKNHGGIVVLRHGNLGSRLGDSMPDYDNVKDDYDVLDPNLFMTGDNQNAGKNGYETNKIKTNGIPVADVDIRGPSWNLPFGQRLDQRIELTLPHYPITMKPLDGSWQIVNGTRFKFFAFSAYYDRRGGRLIRIIGATKTRGPEKVWCRLWYPYKDGKNQNKTKYWSATVIGRVKVIRENWNLKYSACFVLCSLKAESLGIPHSVSIVSRLRAPPGNLLKVRNTDWDYTYDYPNQTFNKRKIPDEISVCVKPIHFNYNQALYIMEYLELNSLLGVSHFTFYNHTIGPQATCVLNHYVNRDLPGNVTGYLDDYEIVDTENTQKKSNSSETLNVKNKMSKKQIRKPDRPTVEILPWDLRMRSQKEIRTEGLFAALNDCLYRNMYRYKYVALIDIDEFLMPRQNNSLKDLLRILNRRAARRIIGSYSFQNAFFYLQFEDDPLILETPSRNQELRATLLTQRKTRRKSKLHPQKQRSKYIARPEKVIEAGNHFIWEFVSGAGTLNVPAESGILHHYRVCEFGGDDCIKSPSIIDRTATRYTNNLIDRVELVYNYLKQQCNLSDLPPLPAKKPIKLKKQLVINKKPKFKLVEPTVLNKSDDVVKMKVKLRK